MKANNKNLEPSLRFNKDMNIKGSLKCNTLDVSSKANFNQLHVSNSIQSPHITSSNVNS